MQTSAASLKMPRVARWALAIAALAAGLLAGTGWVFSGIILKPDRMRGREEAYAERIRPLQDEALRGGGGPFTVDSVRGYPLRGIHFRRRPANDRFIVLAHGYGENLTGCEKHMRVWQELGFDVFLYDQCDSGLSGGHYISCGVFESGDLATIVGFARSRVAPGALAGIAGRSMGGAVVLLGAGSGIDCDFAVAECPYTSFYDEALYRLGIDYPFVPHVLAPAVAGAANTWVRLRAGFDLRGASPLRVVENIRCPLLYINTAEDRFIPTYMTPQLYDRTRAPKTLKVFPRGGHGQALDFFPEEYRGQLRSFLAQVAGRQRTEVSASPR